MRIPRALTIAGSDPSGGAGIQADIKTFSALGVYGVSAITALTSQNTLGVDGIIEVSPDFVSSQIRAVVLDIGVDVVKTGMLCSAALISRISHDLKELGIEKVVVDPVMMATSGDRLLKEDGIAALVSQIFPIAFIITPNIKEAAKLTGMKVENVEDMKRAAERLRLLGPEYVVVKGGHLMGDPVDVLYDGRDFREYRGRRHATPHTHGTGCAFASAMAAYIARGSTVEDAMEGAKAFISDAIAGGLPLGRGHGPIHHFHKFYGFD
jgi:hydroxymethylpyrimidine/phosphomethylpyrimidine kinase